ncbi:MAG: sulfatase-like hydrolase/transferase, partial [Fuerstiella sp.]
RINRTPHALVSRSVTRKTRKIHTPSRLALMYAYVVWFGSPHEPYSGLKEDLALYADLPDSYSKKQVKLTSNETGRPTRRPLKDVLQERYAEITAMDRSMGQLRKWLADNGQRNNTLLWYCGDNGTPGDGIVTSPFRGQKGTMYEGGIRVPGIIEWPEQISQPRRSAVNTVTSDMLPTICELLDVPLPERPLDGVSLKPLIDGSMRERPSPIGFWSFKGGNGADSEPYIAAELQSGTTPLVKMMGDLHTRNFRNFHHPSISESDFDGHRVLLGSRYKLLVRGLGDEETHELFDVRNDPGEQHDLIASSPEIAKQLGHQLRDWQQSVLQSLTGADYK